MNKITKALVIALACGAGLVACAAPQGSPSPILPPPAPAAQTGQAWVTWDQWVEAHERIVDVQWTGTDPRAGLAGQYDPSTLAVQINVAIPCPCWPPAYVLAHEEAHGISQQVAGLNLPIGPLTQYTDQAGKTQWGFPLWEAQADCLAQIHLVTFTPVFAPGGYGPCSAAMRNDLLQRLSDAHIIP
jgi:hypothetical protein